MEQQIEKTKIQAQQIMPVDPNTLIRLDTIENQTLEENTVQESKSGLIQFGSGISSITKSLQSKNFKKGVSGWRLESNGDVYINGTLQ